MKTTLLIVMAIIISDYLQLKNREIIAQGDDKATFYFYRPKKFASSSAKIIIGTVTPDEVILNLKNGSWIKYEYALLGERQFVAGVYAINPEIFTLDIEAGSTHYVRCTVKPQGLKIMANMEFVEGQVTKNEMKGLKEQVKTYTD